MGWILVFLILVSVFSYIATYYLIAFAKKRNLLDVPNNRSSHSVPTPRGGGVSIVLPLIFYILWIVVDDMGSEQFLIWLGGAVLCIAIIAVIDDMKTLSASIRAVLYLLIALIFVLLVSKPNILNFYDVLFAVSCSLAITWGTNLYNFMDGADGLAAIQTLIVSLPVGVIFFLSDWENVGLLFFVVAASTSGFLLWNWSPAKIFMGDVGSCTLGFFFGCMLYVGYMSGVLSIYIWLILLSIFIVDASLTLIKRIIVGEKWYQAHKSHAYQRYLQLGYSHESLAIKVISLALAMLWPFTCLVYFYPQYGLLVTIFVYMFLSVMWYFVQNKYESQIE